MATVNSDNMGDKQSGRLGRNAANHLTNSLNIISKLCKSLLSVKFNTTKLYEYVEYKYT